MAPNATTTTAAAVTPLTAMTATTSTPLGVSQQQQHMTKDATHKGRRRRGQRDCQSHDDHGNNGPQRRQQQQRYSDLGRQRFGRMYPCMVAFSILVYWTTVSVIPVYNKFFFQKSMYPYPIATAGIQLGVVSILLAIINTIQHFFIFNNDTTVTTTTNTTTTTDNDTATNKVQTRGGYNYFQTATTSSTVSSYPDDNNNNNLDKNNTNDNVVVTTTPTTTIQRSWIFGPHFWWKVKWCVPIGGLFGLKYGVTNLGLHLVPAPTHLLLQSTDLVWTVLSAWYINGEIVTASELLCLVGCVAGSVILSWQIEELSSVAAPFYAICINLISPIFLGLCLATLRLACTELMRPDNRVGGTVSSVELTSIKLIVSSSVGLVLACILEGGDEHRAPWWVAFGALASSTRWGVLFGSILISVFQVNCTFLTFLTSAVALGLVGQVKIIPQWFVATFTASRTSNFTLHTMNLVGAVLIMVSAAGFALVNWLSTMTSMSGHCNCRNHRDVEAGVNDDDDDDDEYASTVSLSSSSPLIGDPSTNSSSTNHCCRDDNNNHETKPLLLLSGADVWGADYMRKGYSACNGDETAKIGGCDCHGYGGDNSNGDGGCGCEDCDPKVPFLTATPGDLSSNPSRQPHHHHHHKKSNHGRR